MATGTTRERFALPFPLESESLYEVVAGQRRELPPKGIYANHLASVLHLLLGAFVRSQQLGRVVVEGLFILDPISDLRRRPDIAYVSRERWPLETSVPIEGDWEVIPDLALEVVSPNDTARAVEDKVDEYFQHGVTQVQVLHPSSQRLYLYRSPNAVQVFMPPQDVTCPELFPGWQLSLQELFAN